MISGVIKVLRRGLFRSRWLAALLALGMAALAQTPGSRTAAPLVQTQVDNAQRTALAGHVRPNVASLPDLGPVDDALPLSFFLVMKRSAAQQADLDNLIARQQQRGAPEYHQWLTPQQFGDRFGASQRDMLTISNWLESQGFQVAGVGNGGAFIQFKGTAGQISQSFGSQLHNVSVHGGVFPSTLQEPSIPTALAPAISGIIGLDRIPPRSNVVISRQGSSDALSHLWSGSGSNPVSAASPLVNLGGNDWITPQDFYTIYDVNRVFKAAAPGLNDLAASSSVAVIEQSDIEFGTVTAGTGVATGGDVATFRSLFGVPGTLNMHVYHGYGSVVCTAPGIDPSGFKEDIEASLDAEWANATAPSANLIFMSCSSANGGIFGSLAAVIDNNLADAITLSYGQSEIYANSSLFSFLDSLYAQAAAQGQTILVSSGDAGSDLADQGAPAIPGNVSGINVNVLSASPLVTSAGGTDFSDLYDQLLGGLPQSTYWAATNSQYFGNALGYVPETAWNSNCAGSLWSHFYGKTGAGWCATGTELGPYGGGGGFSTHYAVPAYQAGVPGYSGAQRAQPDISGFASPSDWTHALVYCNSHYSQSNCTSQSSFGSGGGTSYVAPSLAGVAALLNSYTGSRQGLLNPALYALAKAQFTGIATRDACYANGQTSNTGITTGLPASTCIFHDLTTGNNDIPCPAGALNCYVDPGANYGMLSLTGASSLTVAYPSTPGYDEATGIGSVDVYNLLTMWHTAFTSSTSLTASPNTIPSSGSAQLTASVVTGSPSGYVGAAPTLSGLVSFAAGTVNLGSCSLSGGSCTLAVKGSSLASGANSIIATFQGSPAYPSSVSTPVTVTVSGSGSAPLISGVSVSSITNTSAIITWTTDQLSSSQVKYGTTTSYGSSSPINSALVTSHSVTLTGLAAGTTYDYAVFSANSVGVTSTSVNFTFITMSGPTSSATYIGSDTTTQGTWTPTYGADGYVIANDATNAPAYATVSLTGQSAWTWANGTSDPRALQIASGSSTRIASTFYAPSSFNINVNLTDGKVHKIALYLLDWDSGKRVETISILDASTHALLASQSFSGFSTGEYASWNVQGNVVIQVTLTSGENAVVAGIFFGGSVATAAPVITSVTATNITTTSATITWTTDQLSTSLVNYGTTTAYGSSSNLGSALATSHSVTLTGLTPGTAYDYDVVSANTANASTTSGNFTFATPSTAPPLISAVAVSGVTLASATVTWTTDQASTTQVKFGTTTAYGSSSLLNSTLVASHSVTLTGLAPGTTYYCEVVSTNAANINATNTNCTFTTLSSGGSSASFVGLDTATQGNWTGVYGGDGYVIPNDQTAITSYATVSVTGASTWTWAAAGSTADLRALQIFSGATARIASTYYASNSFSINVNITDTNTHKIALYLLDWDSGKRAETISILDAATQTVLNTQSFSNFQNGQFASWDITGSVMIRVTLTGGENAVVAGLFFSSPVANGAPVISSVAASNITSTSAVIAWTTDQVSSSLVAYGTSTAYGLSASGSMLTTNHSITLNGLTPGTKYDYEVSSTNTSNLSSVSGNFTFATTNGGAASSAAYIGSDSTTQGTWTAIYGADGYIIANGAVNAPAYATVSLTGQSAWTWANGTSDPRALQIASGSSTRIASTYYAASTFAINVNLTDGNTHRIALYLLDWDGGSRVETISFLDASTHAVLNTQTFSNFKNGEYASWNVKGNVIIQVTLTSGENAVVAGIFLG